jgi:hypothetical protein
MKLSEEEKQRRKEERNRTKWEKEHKTINNKIYKYCNLHKMSFWR